MCSNHENPQKKLGMVVHAYNLRASKMGSGNRSVEASQLSLLYKAPGPMRDPLSSKRWVVPGERHLRSHSDLHRYACMHAHTHMRPHICVEARIQREGENNMIK